MIKILLVMVGALILSGCASKAVWPWYTGSAKNSKVESRPLCKNGQNECSFDDAMNNMQYAAAYCRDTFNYYEKTLNKKGYVSSGTGIFGVVAGVAASGLTGTTSTVLSGLSASTNAAQAYTDGLVSMTATSGTMDSIRISTENKSADIKKAIELKKYTEASLIALMMANDCAYAPSKVNNQILKSIINK